MHGTSTITDDFYKYFGIKKESDRTEYIFKGIDVSYSQGKIDWDKVKSSGKIEFAIIRAGYGKELNQIDNQFERNYSECKRLGIPIGVYWYSYATTVAEAEQEAKVCLQIIKGKQFEFPVAFDIEESRCFPKANDLCDAFCSVLEKAGYYTAIYTFKSALQQYFSDYIKSRYDIFLSHVDVQKSDYSGDYGLWQYSWKGNINGISGDVDLDYAYKNYPNIIKNAGLNGFYKTEVPAPDEDAKDTSEKNQTDDNDTLKKILEQVESINKKL